MNVILPVSLVQIHREYGQRMEQNDMLERHLLQARVRASESQDKARLLGGEGGLYDGLGLPSGGSLNGNPRLLVGM